MYQDDRSVSLRTDMPLSRPSDTEGQELADALERGEFALYLQFVFDLHSSALIGAEALSRRIRPVSGLQMPGQYLPALYRTGLIARFDFFMLEKTCAVLQDWARQGLQLKLSCNLTRATASAPDFTEQLQAITDRYVFPHDRLILEITEDALHSDAQAVRRNMEICRAAGFSVALDDVLAAYATGQGLYDLPADLVKFDRSLTAGTVTAKGRDQLQQLILLAHGRGADVLCEGVETAEQTAAVRACGSDFIQGFYYSRVYPLSDAMEYYKAYPSA